MKYAKLLICATVIFSFLIPACSSSQKTTGNATQNKESNSKKDSLYIFDEVPPTAPAPKETEKKVQQPEITAQKTLMTYFVVQIGAFTTQEKANEFAESSRKKIQDEITVAFNPTVNLYVVQLAAQYALHEEAEKVRNELWKTEEFKDAWIVTEQK